MKEIAETLEFFAAFSMAMEMGFETLFSLPWMDTYFESKKKERAYLKRVVVLSFCLVLCSVLYVSTGPETGALFLERVFHRRIPYVDVFLTALIMAGGSRAIHDALEGMSGRGAAKRLQSPP